MKTWAKGQPWRVVDGLTRLNQQIRAYAPRSVPPVTDPDSWGSIADDIHAHTSDHFPHYYDVFGSVAVVCARDFPHAPKLGLDGGVITEHMRLARDPRIQYIIFNRRITGVNYGWQWHQYNGTDPHDTHFHVSTVHDKRADGVQLWSLPGMTASSVTPPPVIDKDEDEEDMTTFQIPQIGAGSFAFKPVKKGDQLLVGNDTFGKIVSLRVMQSTGDAVFHAIENSGDVINFESGRSWIVPLMVGTCILSVERHIWVDGKAVAVTADNPGYKGDLSFAIVRN
jgi:hypothetical protein